MVLRIDPAGYVESNRVINGQYETPVILLGKKASLMNSGCGIVRIQPQESCIYVFPSLKPIKTTTGHKTKSGDPARDVIIHQPFLSVPYIAGIPGLQFKRMASGFHHDVRQLFTLDMYRNGKQ
jgi:hypothetical protein